VAAAATADRLFCSGVWIWHLKNKWENWLQKFTVLVFLAFTFHKTLGLRGYKMVDLLSKNRQGAPRMSRWTIYRTVRSVSDCRHCTDSSYSCLNVLILRQCLCLIV
jgi:hypothetical protein